MKVVHLSNKDIQEGAAIAAFRINKALNRSGVQSKMVVQTKNGDSPKVEEFPKTKFQKGLAKLRPIYDKLPLKLYRNRQDGPFSVGKAGVNIAKNELVKQSDVVNLQWIVGGFLSIKSLKGLAKLDKPIVWTLQDQWAFTGGCHYSGECKKYEEICGECPFLMSKRENDISRKIWRKKKKVYQDMDLTVVAISKWLSSCAQKSSLFEGVRVKVIPNTLNTNVFKPIDRKVARNILDLPQQKKLVLFGAVSATRNERKGFRYLIKSLEILKKGQQLSDQNLGLFVFGESRSEEIENLPFETTFMGYLNDNYSLAVAYSAADVFVAPSLEEAFGQTISEAMACGTPTVAFNHSGPIDIIDHKENGYLAEYKSPDDLANGIEWVLSSNDRRGDLGESARNKVLKSYTYDIIGKEYKQLYESLLSG